MEAVGKEPTLKNVAETAASQNCAVAIGSAAVTGSATDICSTAAF